jgi:hypothetical protein
MDQQQTVSPEPEKKGSPDRFLALEVLEGWRDRTERNHSMSSLLKWTICKLTQLTMDMVYGRSP